MGFIGIGRRVTVGRGCNRLCRSSFDCHSHSPQSSYRIEFFILNRETKELTVLRMLLFHPPIFYEAIPDRPHYPQNHPGLSQRVKIASQILSSKYSARSAQEYDFVFIDRRFYFLVPPIFPRIGWHFVSPAPIILIYELHFKYFFLYRNTFS